MLQSPFVFLLLSFLQKAKITIIIRYPNLPQIINFAGQQAVPSPFLYGREESPGNTEHHAS